MLGAALAPRAAATDQPIWFALLSSVAAVPAGGAVAGVIFSVGIAVSQGTAESLPIVLVTTLFSLPLYPLFAPGTGPMAIASVLVGRRLVRAEPRTASLTLAGLVVADAILLALTPALVPWVARVVNWVGDFGR